LYDIVIDDDLVTVDDRALLQVRLTRQIIGNDIICRHEHIERQQELAKQLTNTKKVIPLLESLYSKAVLSSSSNEDQYDNEATGTLRSEV
jgi:hypothetical protein